MTPKQEAFARAYVETGNASEAYRQVYSAEKMSAQVVNNEAYKLLQHHEITVRVQELKASHDKRHAISVDYITDMLVRAAKKAEDEAKGASALVSAAMGLGKLHGHITEKREVRHVNGAEDLNDDELGNIARTGSKRAIAPAPRSSRAN